MNQCELDKSSAIIYFWAKTNNTIVSFVCFLTLLKNRLL